MKKSALRLVLLLVLCSLLVSIPGIRIAKAESTIYIRADGSVEGTNKIQRDGNIYTFADNIFNQSIVVERDNIIVDGGGYTLQGTGSGTGIALSYRSNVTIKNVEIVAHGYGIALYESSGNAISGNKVTNNDYGIELEEFSYDNSICGNNITQNNDDGIQLYWFATGNSISGNNITNNGDGISFVEGGYNVISGNNLANNDICISLAGNSYYNSISGNNITNNWCGIWLEDAIGAYAPYMNTIYHNNFINNTEQVACIYAYPNVWDDGYPSGGNYWSDHFCTGNPSDGSQPYIIDEKNIDQYPFQDPNGWLLPPTLSIVSPENKTYPVEDVPLTFTVSESTSWMGYSLDGQANATVTGNTTLASLLDGSYHVVVYANDTAGNMGASNTVYFTVDTTSPTISVLSPENMTYAVSDVPLSFTVGESASWMGYTLDGQANNTIAGNTTMVGLPDGIHTVTVYANDTAGNMGASNTVYFIVDSIPPNITDVSQTPLEDNVLPEDEIKVNATVTDELSGVKQVSLNYTSGNGTWIAVDMTNFVGNVWNTTIPAFPYGTNVAYKIIAEDNMNNTITTEDLGYEYQYIVIPEFLPWRSMLLILVVLTFAIAIYKRRLRPQTN